MASASLDDSLLLTQLCRLLATDLRLLADLHATELTRERLQNLREVGFPELLALNSQTEALQLTTQELSACIQAFPSDLPDSLLDELACDFADIYLNGKFHGAPNESVWIDEEELTCQQPMFQVRDWYAKHDLSVPNWRKMMDDHLVNELLFIAFLLEKMANEQNSLRLTEAAQFMDEHLLRWLLPFGQRVAARCTTEFYGTLALMTALYLEELRELLASIMGESRPSREEIEARMQAHKLAATQPQTMRYFPGVAPSW